MATATKTRKRKPQLTQDPFEILARNKMLSHKIAFVQEETGRKPRTGVFLIDPNKPLPRGVSIPSWGTFGRGYEEPELLNRLGIMPPQVAWSMAKNKQSEVPPLIVNLLRASGQPV